VLRSEQETVPRSGGRGTLGLAGDPRRKSLTDAALLARMFASLAFFGRRGGIPLAVPGVRAFFQPGAPDRALFNAAVCERPEQLEEALGPLERAYRAAGARQWGIWTPLSPAATVTLTGSGYVPVERTAMGLELAPRAAPPAEPATLDLVGALNDRVYGWRGDARRGFARLGGGGLHTYHAERKSCVLALDHGGDCAIYGVATVSRARGRGLATRLLERALADAYGRGQQTSTLQATPDAERLYRRVGYREIGRLQFWYRRT
jgi:ribosomal protein S18 acetylase RimI-like enzyme